MTIKYSVDKQQNLVKVTMEDKVELGDFIKASAEYSSDNDFHYGINLIYDFTEASLNLSADDMVTIVSILKSRNNKIPYKLGMVTSADDIFGQGRMFDAYAEDLPFEIQIFRDMAPCLLWINQ